MGNSEWYRKKSFCRKLSRTYCAFCPGVLYWTHYTTKERLYGQPEHLVSKAWPLRREHSVHLPQWPQNSHLPHGRRGIFIVCPRTRCFVRFTGGRVPEHQQGDGRLSQPHCEYQPWWRLYHVRWPHFSRTQARFEQPSPSAHRNRADRHTASPPEYAEKMHPAGWYAAGILRDRAYL